MAINRLIFPIDGDVSGRVCACSLHSRLVLILCLFEVDLCKNVGWATGGFPERFEGHMMDNLVSNIGFLALFLAHFDFYLSRYIYTYPYLSLFDIYL